MSPQNPPNTLTIDDTPMPRDLHLPAWFLSSFLDLGQDLQTAIEQEKEGLIIYFGQENCAYCEYLLQINWGERQDIIAYTQRYFAVVAIDIWGSLPVTDFAGRTLTERDFADREQTQFTPTLIFYNTQGKAVFRLRGYYPPYQFRAALDYVIGQYYRRLPFHLYLEQAEQPMRFELEELTPNPIFAAPPYLLTRSEYPATHYLAVFFEQSLCHACDFLHSTALQNPQIIEQFAMMEVVQLNRWANTPVITTTGQALTAQQWADQLQVFFTPTIIFFDAQGQEIIRVDAIVGLYRLQRVLQYVLTGAYQTAPNFQRWHAQQQSEQWYQTHPVLGDF